MHIFARPTLLMIGRLNALRNEIQYEDFATPDKSGAYKEGVFNDLLRVDRFLPSSLRARTRLIPAAAEEPIVKASDSPPKLVIFDGADTHLRWCHHFKATDAVSIFCQRDTQLDDAVANINQRYATRCESKDRDSLKVLEPLQREFDGIAFLEARR